MIPLRSYSDSPEKPLPGCKSLYRLSFQMSNVQLCNWLLSLIFRPLPQNLFSPHHSQLSMAFPLPFSSALFSSKFLWSLHELLCLILGTALCLKMHITFAGAGSGLTVLASPGRTQPPQYDVVLKRVPALPPGPAWECELSLARAPAQGCGFVWSLSFNSKKEGPCLASFPSPGFLCVLLNIPEISCH